MATETHTVLPGQNIWDICMTLYGSPEGLYDLLSSNPGLSTDADIEAGQTLTYHTGYILDSRVKAAVKNILIANGERPAPPKLTQKAYVRAQGVKTTFTAAGDGCLFIDWGDGSEIEAVDLCPDPVIITHSYKTPVHDVRWLEGDQNISFSSLDLSDMDSRWSPVSHISVQDLAMPTGCSQKDVEALVLVKDTRHLRISGNGISDLSAINSLDLRELDLRGGTITQEAVASYVQGRAPQIKEGTSQTIITDRAVDLSGVASSELQKFQFKTN